MSKEIGATLEAHRDASQRFDYFILGLSVALVAYAGKTLQPEKLGVNPYTLEVASLLVLIASIVAGFKRIEQTILAHHVRFDLLDLRQSRGMMAQGFIEGKTRIMPERGEKWEPEDMKREIDRLDLLIPVCESKFEEVGKKGAKFYGWRNGLLICGFVGFFFSKLLIPYWK